MLNPGAVAIPAAEDPKQVEGYALQPLSLLLLLGAFANGCTALMGVEAISNGVPAFRKPESRNATTTLVWMALLLTVMLLGTSGLAKPDEPGATRDLAMNSERGACLSCRCP